MEASVRLGQPGSVEKERLSAAPADPPSIR